MVGPIAGLDNFVRGNQRPRNISLSNVDTPFEFGMSSLSGLVYRTWTSTNCLVSTPLRNGGAISPEPMAGVAREYYVGSSLRLGDYKGKKRKGV
jgi:hypothetical protein